LLCSPNDPPDYAPLHGGHLRSLSAALRRRASVMTTRRRMLVLRVLLWTAIVIVFVLAVVPHPPVLPGRPSDKIQHVAAFAVLASLAWLAYPETAKLRIGIYLALFGALIELVQAIPGLGRDADPVDWAADLAAISLVLLVLAWWTRRSDS